MKKAKKTMVAQVVIKQHKKNSKIPDFGQGKGVLLTQEIDFMDDRGRGFKSPMFAMALIEHEDRLLREIVEVKWTEKKKK